MTPTARSEVGRIRRLLLKHPRDAWVDQAQIDAEWRQLHYLGPPDMVAAIREYDAFVELLRGSTDAHLDFLPRGLGVGLDSIYVRDAAVVTGEGVVLCRMGKEARRGEPAAQAKVLRHIGNGVLGEITGPGTLEGGDVVWLDDHTVAVGLGYRTNSEGIQQLRTLLGDRTEVIVAHLPHFKGPADVFHLMSILSPLDVDLALVHSPLLPVSFRRRLLERGTELVEVPADELDTGPNVLALGPRRCVAVAGNPVTRKRLEAAGVEVLTYIGNEITAKGCGGPTCLTRPLVRDGV